MRKLFLLVLFMACSCGQETRADDPKFMRIKKNDKDTVIGLDIARTKYTNKDKTISVYLDGVVHYADHYYYYVLNRKFKDYDAVLYELVAPPDMKPKKTKNDGSVGYYMKRGILALLDLDSQLEKVDYSPKNFIHADLSFEGMQKAASERGEDKWTIGLSLLADTLRKQNLAKSNPQQEMKELENLIADPKVMEKVLRNPNVLKRILAKQMVDQGDEAALGQTMKTLLVDDRNKEACRVLSREITNGKKNISIFYGAAHMPDFHRRMLRDFGLEMVEQEWITAWNMESDHDTRLLRLIRLFDED
jgi:hypothetical protein